MPIKKGEGKASEEPAPLLPAETDARELIQKKDKDKADESPGEEKPKIILSGGELDSKPEEAKKEPEKEKDQDKDSTTDV